MENTILIEKYINKIEAELNRCIGELETIKGGIKVDEVIEDLQNLRDELY